MDEQSKIRLILLEKNSHGEALPTLDAQQEKIISSICALDKKNFNTLEDLEEIICTTESNAAYLMHISLAEDLYSREKLSKNFYQFTLYYSKNDTQKLNLKIQEDFSHFCIDNAPSADLVRILYQHFSNKKNAGIYTLMEKGSLILGEKIQGTQNIGLVLDQLHEHLSKVSPEILGQFQNIRQLITAMVGEALELCTQLKMSYPTVDFQFSANQQKAAFAIRFPKGALHLQSLRKDLLTGEALSWFLAWKACDFLLIKEIAENEVEVKGLIFSTTHKKICSLLTHKTEDKANSKNLLSAPSSYNFALINEIKTKKLLLNNSTAAADKVEKDSNNQQEQIAIMSNKVKMLTKELLLKKNEAIKKIQLYEAEIENLKKKNSDTQKNLEFYIEKSKEPAANTINKGDVRKILEAQYAGTKEKDFLLDKIQNEEKRFLNLEQKYANLHKELQEKSKENIELKSKILKNKMEMMKGATANTSSGSQVGTIKEMEARLRDSEAKEAFLKQEIKKIAFKLEASDKNFKIQKEDLLEKIKLMEKKLEEAKQKEVDLLKKVDDLGAMLRKKLRAA